MLPLALSTLGPLRTTSQRPLYVWRVLGSPLTDYAQEDSFDQAVGNTFAYDVPGRYLAQAKASIRLLELLPGQLEDSLQCTLRAYDLAHAPTYEALSYCWGPASSLLPITIDGDSLMVTPNLRSALRHLRRTDYARTLWIDAICINQDDVEERGAQVAIMADIYRNAAQTVIWLGPSESHSRQALRTLALLSEKPRQPKLTELRGRVRSCRAKAMVLMSYLLIPAW